MNFKPLNSAIPNNPTMRLFMFNKKGKDLNILE